MNRFRYTSYLMAVMLLFSVSDSGHADEQLQALAAQGTAILKARCYGCHGEKFNGSAQFNVMDTVALVEHGYIVPSDAPGSTLWQRVEAGEMPPEDSGVPPLTTEERVILQQWIAAGGPQVQREQRPFKPYSEVIRDIHVDLTQAARDDRPYYRYFTLTHLSNNYSHVTDFDVRLYRAALPIFYASCTIQQKSYERDEWRHSAFTKAILDVLADSRADVSPRTGDGLVSAVELALGVTDKVRTMTGDRQEPVVYSPDRLKRLNILEFGK